jgi:hypothetical protein
MEMVESEEQYENADSSMRNSFEFDSNVTTERFEHPEKQREGRTSREAGTELVDRDDQPRNPWSDKSESLESDSNANIEGRRKSWQLANAIF